MTGFEFHHTILVVVQVLLVGLICVLFFSAHQRKLTRRHEFSKQFLDKLSSEEFIALLESSAGRRSVERVLGTYKTTDEWITDAIRRSMVLMFGGIAALVVYIVTDFSGREIFLAIGCLSIGGAIGYLIAAALTRVRARREDAETAL